MRGPIFLCAATLVACGSSSDKTPAGPSYSAMSSAAGFDQTANCALGASTTIGASIALVNVTDYASPTACASMTSNTVALHGAAAAIAIVRADFSLTGGAVAAPGLVAEAYPFFDLASLGPPANKIPPFDIGGKAAFFTGALLGCGATAGAGTSAAIDGGTVTVTQLLPNAASPTQVVGSVNASLAGGGTLTGTFTADLCPGAPVIDVCAAIQARSLNLPPPTCG